MCAAELEANRRALEAWFRLRSVGVPSMRMHAKSNSQVDLADRCRAALAGSGFRVVSGSAARAFSWVRPAPF